MLLKIYFKNLSVNITVMFSARAARLIFNMFSDTKSIQVYDFTDF